MGPLGLSSEYTLFAILRLDIIAFKNNVAKFVMAHDIAKTNYNKT